MIDVSPLFGMGVQLAALFVGAGLLVRLARVASDA